MNFDKLNIKFFTIFLSLLYVFGLCAFFENHEIACAFLVLLFLVFAVLYLKVDFKKVLVLYGIFFLGIINAQKSNDFQSILENKRIDNVILNGQIISSKNISTKNKKIKFFIRADKINVLEEEKSEIDAKILVNLDLTNGIENSVEIGDYIEIKGNLRSPKEASNPHQFDYKKYLLNQDCKSILYGKNETFKIIRKSEFGKNKTDSWYFLLNCFEKTRNNIIEKHSKNIHSPNLEILGGIVFGNETINPDEEIKENFKNAGLLHLLAASGLNVALIYGIWWWIATLIKFPFRLSILLGAGFVIFYTFMTGFPPSILRASLMLLFVLFGKLIDRNADSVALVAFVGFLILLFEPKMLFDVGFQLSFAVTFGLIILCPMLIEKFDKTDKQYREKFKDVSRIKKYFIFLFSPKKLIAIVAIPLVAQICVIPLQMHYFNTFSLFSVLANIVVVPFVGILSFVGFLGSIASLIPCFGETAVFAFDLVANPLLSLLIKTSEVFSSLKYSTISTFGLNLFQIFMFWLLCCFFFSVFKNNFKNKKLIIGFCLSCLIFIFSFLKFDYFEKNLEINMFDVGNADSFLIKTPKNKYILIDTGAKMYHSMTSAQFILNKYFKNERIKKLEKVIITHFDADHSGGVIDVLKNIPTHELFIQNTQKESNTKREILEYLNDTKINYKYAKNNEIIYKEKDLVIKTFVLNFENETRKIANENSIVTLLEYKGKNILFMADVGASGFFELEKYLPKEIEILKIGHHGAKNSVNQGMLERIKPKSALISVGNNKFNHPDLSVIDLLNKNNVKIISTKEYGFVRVVCKNSENDYYFYNAKKKKLEKINIHAVDKNLTQDKFIQKYIRNNK